MLLLLQLNPAHTHTPHCKWCCYYGCIKCTWQARLGDSRSPDPPHSSVTRCLLCQVEEGQRLAIGGFISSWGWPRAAAGRGPAQLLASFLAVSGWLWFIPGSCGPPRAVPARAPGASCISWPCPMISTPSLVLGREASTAVLMLGISWDPSYTGGYNLYGRQNICLKCELINKPTFWWWNWACISLARENGHSQPLKLTK